MHSSCYYNRDMANLRRISIFSPHHQHQQRLRTAKRGDHQIHYSITGYLILVQGQMRTKYLSYVQLTNN